MSANNNNNSATVKRLVASIVQFLGAEMSSTSNHLTTDAQESLEGEYDVSLQRVLRGDHVSPQACGGCGCQQECDV